jgi:tetratricopeptide (TPR) repeat protein
MDIKSLLTAAITDHRAGKLDAAAAGYKRVLKLDAHQPDALNLLGLIAATRGQREEALGLFAEALKVNPNAATYYFNRANVFAEMQRYEDAIADYKKSIVLRSEYSDARLNLGALQHKSKDLQGAIQTFRDMVSHCPNDARGYFNLGRCLNEAKTYDDAEAALHRALKLDPENPDVLLTLAKVNADQWRFEAAISLAKRALARRPRDPLGWTNLGTYEASLDRFDEALAAYNEALDVDPNWAEARLNRALTELALGRFETGWDGYAAAPQSDAKTASSNTPLFPWRQWRGEPLKGKRIFVWADQGLGDQILYSAMLPEILTEASACVLGCSARLAELFKRSFPTLEVRPDLAPHKLTAQPFSQSFDYYTPIIDIGRWRRRQLNQFPNRSSYLKVDRKAAADVRARYQTRFPDAKLLVGVSWRSFAPHIGHQKSLPLEDWAALFCGAGSAVQPVSLQYGDASSVAADLAAFQNVHGLHLYVDPTIDPYGDLDRQAAQIGALDLVVTVSNTNAHLAGALGVPLWVAVPGGKARLWYWLTQGEYSAWYPRASISREGLAPFAKRWTALTAA